MKYFILGGGLSLILAILFFSLNFNTDIATYSGALMVGLIEEVAKAAIVAIFLFKSKKSNYILNGLLADYVKEVQAIAIVKGLRAVSDFEYEFQMALANKKLYAGAETVFLTTTAENMYLSSSVVKQIANFGGDISHFVPSCILKDIEKRLVKENGHVN